MFVGDLALGSLPNMFDGVMVWCIGREMYQIEIF